MKMKKLDNNVWKNKKLSVMVLISAFVKKGINLIYFMFLCSEIEL